MQHARQHPTLLGSYNVLSIQLPPGLIQTFNLTQALKPRWNLVLPFSEYLILLSRLSSPIHHGKAWECSDAVFLERYFPEQQICHSSKLPNTILFNSVNTICSVKVMMLSRKTLLVKAGHQGKNALSLERSTGNYCPHSVSSTSWHSLTGRD